MSHPPDQPTPRHEMRPECAAQFAALMAHRTRDDINRANVRNDIHALHAKVDEGFREVREGLITLRERSRTWGAVAGTITSLLVSITAGVIIAVILM